MKLSAVFIAGLAGALLVSAAPQRFLKWKDAGVSSGATLPPAENFNPRAHGDEATKAGLKPFQTFTQRLAEPVRVVAVRVLGRPVSGNYANQAYSSCAELEAFAD